MRTILMILVTATMLGCGAVHTLPPDSDADYSEEDASLPDDAYIDLEDAGTEDAAPDAFVALEDAGTDAYVTPEVDAGVDSGPDAPYDAGAIDSGPVVVDAGRDAGPMCSHPVSTRPTMVDVPPASWGCPEIAWQWTRSGMPQHCCAEFSDPRVVCLRPGEMNGPVVVTVEGWYTIDGYGCSPSTGRVSEACCS